MGGEDEIHDYPSLKAQVEEPTKTFGSLLLNLSQEKKIRAYPRVDYQVPTPVSEQMRLWPYDEVREFNQPAFKRCYISEKEDLLENGYPEWVANRVKEIGTILTVMIV